MTYTLLCVEPTNQAQQLLTAFRQRIFQSTGHASALALPPVIPLCWLPGGLRPTAVREILAAHKLSLRFAESGISGEDGIFYLQTHCKAQLPPACASLETRLRASRRPAPAGGKAPALFPVVPGFFLAVHCGETSLAALRAVWDACSAPLALATYQVVMLKIIVHAEPGAWWRSVEWESAAEVKCRAGVME